MFIHLFLYLNSGQCSHGIGLAGPHAGQAALAGSCILYVGMFMERQVDFPYDTFLAGIDALPAGPALPVVDGNKLSTHV